MKYNKLVRDKIPEFIKKQGGDPVFHIAAKKEYWAKLKEKLEEEVKEFLQAENIEELADIMEVLEAIQTHKKFSRKKLKELKVKKAKERGKFKRGIILDES